MAINLSSKQEVKDNFAFERQNQPRADKLWKALGFTVRRITGPENKYYDVELAKNGEKVTVEEKFLRKDSDVIFVELIQDTETDSPGWIEYTRADYLLYVMPSQGYLCKMPRLREFIRMYGSRYRTHVCTKGWGRTVNCLLPLDVFLDTSNNLGWAVGMPT